jgi:hypothetical protein
MRVEAAIEKKCVWMCVSTDWQDMHSTDIQYRLRTFHRTLSVLVNALHDPTQ